MLNKNTDNPHPGPDSKKPKISEGQLEPLFRRLNLAHTRRIYQDVADRAEKENWSYRDFLALLLAEEVAHRKQTRLQRCTRQAHFPFFKTIDEFDFSLQTTLRQSLLGSYLGPDFVTEGRSPGSSHRLSRYPEWLRHLVHHCRRTRRRPFQCWQEGPLAGIIANLYASSRFGCR